MRDLKTHLFLIHNSPALLILDPHPPIPHSPLFNYSVLPGYYGHDDLTFTIVMQWFSHRAIQQ